MFTLHQQWQLTSDNNCVAKFSPDGCLLAIVQDLTVLIYSINDDSTGTLNKTLITDHVAPISDLVWCPDGQCVATASDDYSIEITHLQYGHLHSLTAHTAPVTSLTYNPRGNLLFSASMDESIKVWDTLNGDLLKTISAHSEPVVSIDLSPGDETILCSGSYDGLIRVFDSLTGHCLKTLTYDKDWKRETDGGVIPIVKVQVSYNAKYILVRSLDGVIKLWDIVSGVVVRVYDSNNEGKHTMMKYDTDCTLFYPSSQQEDPVVVGGDENGSLHCWSINKPGQELQTLRHAKQNSPIMCVDTSTRTNLMCSLSLDGECSLWKWE